MNIIKSIYLSDGKCMNIMKSTEDKTLVIALEGSLDTSTAPQLETELKHSIGDSVMLVLDFENLEFLSPAGLRVLQAAQEMMNKQGKMVIRGVNEVISKVFEVTGFSDILTIEQ